MIYLCILDFEATCVNPSNGNINEIIEFPSILLQWDCNVLGSGGSKIVEVARFQEYVKPKDNPKLSTFCTDLTGITQEQVNNAKTFPEVFELHQKWISKYVTIDDQCIIVTCGNWDIESMLPKDIKRHKLKCPALYKQFCNIKTVFQNRYKVRPRGLQNMLRIIKEKFEGRQHSGIIDCHNIAKIMVKLVNDKIKKSDIIIQNVSHKYRDNVILIK